MGSWLGTAWGLGSAISWACANASIQVAGRRVGSWSALVWAQIIGGVVAVLVALAVEGRPMAGWTSAVPSIVGAGMAAALAYGGLFESLARGQVAIVSPIISAWSVVSVAIVAVRGKPPTLLVSIGVGLVVLGNVLVARSSAPGESEQDVTPRSAILWALAAACGFGIMAPLLDHVGATVGRLWAVPAVWTVELVILIPILAFTGNLVAPRSKGDVTALTRAALFEVAGFIALSLGLGTAAVSIVSPVSSLSTMGSVALGVLLLRERVSRAALVGAVLASVGVVVINL